MSSQQPEPVQSPDPPQPTVTKLESDSVSGGTGAGRNPRDGASIIKPKRPVSISGFKSSLSAASSASTLPGKKPVLPASSLIYQDADVGVDLGSARRAAGRGAGFIKPADVDAPPPPPPQPQKKPVIDSAGAQIEQKKRTMDTSDSPSNSDDVPEDTSRKRRKK